MANQLPPIQKPPDRLALPMPSTGNTVSQAIYRVFQYPSVIYTKMQKMANPP
jgi:hypothetical protein